MNVNGISSAKKWLGQLLGLFFLYLLASSAFSQTVYGVGGNAGVYDRIYTINPTTGAATTPSVASSISTATPVTESVALGVSPINGLVYIIERYAATPRIVTWNPATGAFAVIGNAGTPAGISSFLRATFCPDGRFYIAGNGSGGGAGAEIYQINPTNAALIRTVVVSNLPTQGSGDIACVSNGDLFIIAQSATAPNPYQLYRIPEATINSASTDLTITATLQGDAAITNTQAINGLAERPDGSLIASVAFNQTAMYSITTSTFGITTLTTTDPIAITDLGRGFPLGLSLSKSITPTSLVQGTQTVTYTVIVNNAGPAVVGSTTITDTISANFSTATWVCGVRNTGKTNTMVTTACGTASGTGNINNTASLSINGQIVFTVTAVLRSTFTGTISNSANGTVSSLLTVVTPTSSITTVTATVQPAASLTVSKTNGVTTTAAGVTRNYTVTFSNLGPGSADNAVIQEVPGAGLANCSVVSCSGAGTPTSATCPATPSQSLSPSTTTIPTFPANSSVTLVVRCGVNATGL